MTMPPAIQGNVSRYRRRGSALILVVTVLGILFVTGVAFLTTIRFDATLLSLERQAARSEVAVRQAGGLSDTVLTESWLNGPGLPGGETSLGESKSVSNPAAGTFPANFDAFRAMYPTYSELPVVHPLFGPIEPYYVEAPPHKPTESTWVYGWFTDLYTLRNGPTAGSILGNNRYIDTTMRNLETLATYHLPTQDQLGNIQPFEDQPTDPNAPRVADADGDGVVDSILVDLETIGVSPSQIAELNKIVQPPGIAGEKVYVGLRIVPNSGMVNVSEGHPAIIGAVLGLDHNLPDDEFMGTWSRRLQVKTYSAQSEESPIRRRGFIPAPQLPQTMLQGNPLTDPKDGGDPDNIGEGHFSSKLFPPGESVLAGAHRYEPYDMSTEEGRSDWWTRMNAESTEGYDLRHLVTTISHDNLLARPTQVWVTDTSTMKGVALEGDAVSKMVEVNRGTDVTACAPIFEYPNYPHHMPNVMMDPNGVREGSWCECSWSEQDAPCKLDPRKGRLKVSLPWLDLALMNAADDRNEGAAEAAAEVLDVGQRIQLIQDVFSLLLLNARGPEWGTFEVPQAGAAQTQAVWTWANQSGLARLQRTAAALTANLLDFADADDTPTRVAVRSMDYGDVNVVGRELSTREYVYGLEKHLLITEVAAKVVEDSMRVIIPEKTAYAIELFNPFDVELPNASTGEFFIRLGPDKEIMVPRVRAKSFYVIVWSPDASLVLSGPGGLESLLDIQNPEGIRIADGRYGVAASELVFTDGEPIYLVMEPRYIYPGTTHRTQIVVDQFDYGSINQRQLDTGIVNVYSRERAWNGAITDRNSPIWPWFATIPTESTATPQPHRVNEHTLGIPNTATDASLKPVQLVLGNTGSIQSAFPTTGTMLLLTRHANRAMEDLARLGVKELAWTTNLLASRDQIDNGRMPVFDMVNKHHLEPKDDPRNPGNAFPKDQPGELSQLPWGQLVFDYFTALPLQNPGVWSDPDAIVNDPTVIQSAQPRVSLDGLQVDGRVDINSAPWKVLSGLPLMPMEKFAASFQSQIRRAVGLVPTTQGNQYQPNHAQLNTPDDRAATIGPELAMAIVAYREARAIGVQPNSVNNIGEYTGDYNEEVLAGGAAGMGFGRGWRNLEPKFRRGTGYLSVGELANVRHEFAGKRQATTPGGQPIRNWDGFSYYRMDRGFVDGGAEFGEYVSAVATLVALGDWVTTHSDVYTVYGTLWGSTSEENVPVKDFEDHALRFQETVDRLPVFLGKPTPVRIGERVISRYNDIFHD